MKSEIDKGLSTTIKMAQSVFSDKETAKAQAKDALEEKFEIAYFDLVGEPDISNYQELLHNVDLDFSTKEVLSCTELKLLNDYARTFDQAEDARLKIHFAKKLMNEFNSGAMTGVLPTELSALSEFADDATNVFTAKLQEVNRILALLKN